MQKRLFLKYIDTVLKLAKCNYTSTGKNCMSLKYYSYKEKRNV